MAIMEVVLSQSYFGQQVINRWNYLASGTPAATTFSFALLKAMGFVETAGIYPPNTIFDAIRLITSTSLTYAEVIAKDVYSVTDFYTLPFAGSVAGTGSGAGTPTSPFTAFAVRTNRVRADIRRGQKRFAGVGESAIGDFGALTAGLLSGLETVAALMSDVLTYNDEGNTLTFTPIVVGREAYSPTPGARAYRYYPTEAAQLQHIATGVLWTANEYVTTQNSRKSGRGA